MKTHRAVTPFELAIDRACGFDRGSNVVRIMVPVFCSTPKCRQRVDIPAEESWPDGLVKIVMPCPKCSGGKVCRPDQVKLFDGEGREL